MKNWADPSKLTPRERKLRRAEGRGHLSAEWVRMAEIFNEAFDAENCGIVSDGHNRKRALFLITRWWARDWCLEEQDEARGRVVDWCSAIAVELSQFLEYRWRNRYRKLAARHPDWSPALVVEACRGQRESIDACEARGEKLLKEYGRDWYDMEEGEDDGKNAGQV